MSRHKGSEGSVRLTPGRGRGCGRPNGRVRRVRDVITDYVEAQKNSTRVERCPRAGAPAAAYRQQGDRKESRPKRMDALWDAWVQSFPDVVPRLGMDWGNITDLDSHRRMS